MNFATIRQRVMHMIVATFMSTESPNVRSKIPRSRIRGLTIPKSNPKASQDRPFTPFVTEAISIPMTIPHRTGNAVYLINFIISKIPFDVTENNAVTSQPVFS